MDIKAENKILLDKIYNAHYLKRFISFIIGLMLMAISYNLFTRKCNLIYGVGGIGIILEEMYGLNPALVVLFCNLILLLMSFIFLGKEQTRNTILGSLLYPLFIKITEPLINVSLGNVEVILITLCGSLIMGIGLGLVFKAGYTSGGTDILNQIVSKYAKMSVGTSMYFTDFLVILASIFVFGFSTFVYSVLSLYIISLIMDKVIIGISSSKAFYIITENETAIKRFITQNLSHGVTILEARGGYTGNMEKVIMCIVPTKEYYVFKEGIKMIDKNAFFIVTDAYEVSGGV